MKKSKRNNRKDDAAAKRQAAWEKEVIEAFCQALHEISKKATQG